VADDWIIMSDSSTPCFFPLPLSYDTHDEIPPADLGSVSSQNVGFLALSCAQFYYLFFDVYYTESLLIPTIFSILYRFECSVR
jgi:hypothetical protein